MWGWAHFSVFCVCVSWERNKSDLQHKFPKACTTARLIHQDIDILLCWGKGELLITSPGLDLVFTSFTAGPVRKADGHNRKLVLLSVAVWGLLYLWMLMSQRSLRKRHLHPAGSVNMWFIGSSPASAGCVTVGVFVCLFVYHSWISGSHSCFYSHIQYQKHLWKIW